MTHRYSEFVSLETEECCNCHMIFAMPADFRKRRLDDHELFYCPAGHGQLYSGKSEKERLKDELARKEEILEAERRRNASLAKERDGIAKAHGRMRKRIANGVCPCCNRTFQNLLQHMQTEHNGKVTLKELREAFGMTQAQVAEEVGVQTSYVSLVERGQSCPQWAEEVLTEWMNQNMGEKA